MNRNFTQLLIGASLIGLAPLFVRWSELSPSWVVVYRMFLALPMIAILNFYINGRQAFKFKSKKNFVLTLVAGIAFGMDLVSWHWGIVYTSIANATILVNTAPAFVLIFAWLFFSEKISRESLIYFLITYIGVFGLIYFSSHLSERSTFGDLLSIFSALCYAVYLLMLSRLGQEDSINVIFFTSLFCGLLGLSFAIFESSVWMPTGQDFLELVALAFLCQFGGQFLLTYALPRVSASSGAVGLLMQPITATIFGMILFAEWISPIQFLFIIIALSGIYLSRKVYVENL